ncbi:MAG: HAD family hydrolase, partial [Faecousia sp.]
MFSDVLLTVDYDRTLTAPDSSIPQRNIRAIEFFIENGGAFTVNTGRSIPMAQAFIDKVPVSAPLILYNGSAAYDVHTREFTKTYPIEL